MLDTFCYQSQALEKSHKPLNFLLLLPNASAFKQITLACTCHSMHSSMCDCYIYFLFCQDLTFSSIFLSSSDFYFNIPLNMPGVLPERLAPKIAAGSQLNITQHPGLENGVSLTVLMRNEKHKNWRKKFLRDLEKEQKNVACARRNCEYHF